MKHLFLLFAVLCMAAYGLANPVSRAEAEQVAITFYTHNAPVGISDYSVENVTVMLAGDLPTFYTFTFNSGGFVIVAADDASLPILGYSFENGMPEEITNPATKEWLESYSQEINNIISARLSNRETLEQWDKIRNGNFPSPTRDVNPLLTTTWDQGCFYNVLCPYDASGPCQHVYTGCVATAMAQIMKYHNFPPQGVGSHTYTCSTYGPQTADFGNTTYDWASMPNSVTGSNLPTATIMYHAGVSVDMMYSASGSGAYSENVPAALLDYFNYHPDITIAYKDDYSNVDDFKALLRDDLDNALPIYYSGSNPSVGHAFVCDGYRMSDEKFHFNWGWSGAANGWYAIGALNPGGNTFNQNNTVVLHVKPFNPDLIVRITHPVNYAIIGVGYAIDIDAVTVRGTPSTMKIFIDNNEMASGSDTALTYTWNTTSADLGSHEVRAYSYTATDTVYYKIILNVAEWISQASGFSNERGINYMWAVDSNVVWAAAYDVSNPTGACQDVTRTLDGGETWMPGVINNCSGLASSMIFGMDSNKAWVPMYRASGSNPQGIYATEDGGATWTRQTSASYSNSASFPNVVHFFNETDGFCMGDPINNEYEIYTTTNGGANWVLVPGANIPNPLSGEFGVVGYYSAVNDTVWFGTNKGRVYKSADKGLNWTVSVVQALNGKYIKPSFRSGMHGLVQDKDAGKMGTICETFDGGTTWTLVTTTGPIYPSDLAYVPGTENTWVSTGSLGSNGCSYSFDGGHTWADFTGTQGSQYMNMSWVNNHCGWAGGVNSSETENGTYKYIGVLLPPLPAPFNLQADVVDYEVHLTWEAPVSDHPTFTLLGYNLYRDGIRLNSTPITELFYDDQLELPGAYTYCLKAQYDIGESNPVCVTVDVAVTVSEQEKPALMISPNPAQGMMSLRSDLPIDEIRIFDIRGKEYARIKGSGNLMIVDISELSAGYYTVTAISGTRVMTAKLLKD